MGDKKNGDQKKGHSNAGINVYNIGAFGNFFGHSNIYESDQRIRLMQKGKK